MKLAGKNDRSRCRIGAGLCALFLLLPIVSCGWVGRSKSKDVANLGPPILQNGVSSDSVGIEVFTIRVSMDQDGLFRQLWQEVDEQMLEPALRRDLIGHGLRVGFLGETLSPSLSRLINVTSERTAENKSHYGEYQEVSLADLSKDLAVTRQYVNLMPDMRAALKVFDDRLPEFSRFWTENGNLCGQTYTDVLGLIQISGISQNNGKARLTIIPILEYGITERRVRVHNGLMFQENGRPRYQYKSLTVSLDLLPGQWVILGPVSRESTGAGRAFFIRGAEEGEQKMIAIRLSKLKTETPPGLSPSNFPQSGNDFSIQERN